MKTKMTILIACIIITFITCSKEQITGSEPIITELRAVSNFAGVKTAGSNNIFVQQEA